MKQIKIQVYGSNTKEHQKTINKMLNSRFTKRRGFSIKPHYKANKKSLLSKAFNMEVF